MAEHPLTARLGHRLGHPFGRVARALRLPGPRTGPTRRVDGRDRHRARGPARHEVTRGAPTPARTSRMARRQAAKLRRNRALLAGTALLSALIMVLWFPAASLLHQRAAINASAAELNRLQQEDRQLAQEQKALGSPAEIARIAREQYQLVNPGERAFEVLPANSTKKGATTYAGDPANQPVASPSAASELPPGSGSVGSGATSAGSSAGTPSGAPGAAGTTGRTGGTPAPVTSPQGKSSAPGFLGRIAQTLEFWR